MFAQEGKKILSALVSITLITGLLLYFFTDFIWIALFLILLVLLLFSSYFFRDPVRNTPENDQLIVAPADGKIVRIQTINDVDIGDGSTLISIFLSIFNVHVNRMPINAEFESVTYCKGKFLAAFNHDASDENERTNMILNHNGLRLRVKQIAGILARRIHCYAEENQTMDQGGRLGFIRFGSRTDLILPAGIHIKIALNQKVIGGETVIGEIK